MNAAAKLPAIPSPKYYMLRSRFDFVQESFILGPLLVVEGSLEAKLPTIWTDEKAEQGRGREKRQVRRKTGQKKEDAAARKGRNVVKH